MCNFNTFLRSVTQPVTSAINRALTAPGTGGQEAQQQQLQVSQDALLRSQQQAQDATTAALAAQEAAAKRVEAAAVPQADLDVVRIAREGRMRRLAALSSGIRMGARSLGEAPLGFRMLTGQ